MLVHQNSISRQIEFNFSRTILVHLSYNRSIIAAVVSWMTGVKPTKSRKSGNDFVKILKVEKM